MSEDQLERARYLINTNRYQEAKQLLEQTNHPTAKQWLEKVNARLQSSEPVSTSKQDFVSMSAPHKPSIAQEIVVTTTDLQYPYQVIAPVYFQTSNKGLFSSNLSKLKQKYKDEIAAMKTKGAMTKHQLDLGFIWYGEFSVGQNDFEAAFYVSIRELQNRAWSMKADAIVGMRQDIDLDTSGWQFFYLQMYGTAVRYL